MIRKIVWISMLAMTAVGVLIGFFVKNRKHYAVAEIHSWDEIR